MNNFTSHDPSCENTCMNKIPQTHALQRKLPWPEPVADVFRPWPPLNRVTYSLL